MDSGKLGKFIKKAELVHPGKYDYSKVEYKNAHTNIEIICPLHGSFLQRPDAHLHQKQGCPHCGLANRKHPGRKTTTTFIEQAKNKWGSQYDYSETVYKNKQTKIEYICPKHGKIEQQPTLHLRSGCPYCNGRGINKHTSQTFINLASACHENKYDYSKVKLNKITDYVTIVCPKHGDFDQRANNHIHLKNGCPKCDIEKTASKAEKELLQYIKSLYAKEIVENDRTILDGKEMDVFIPELNLGFEYHGMYWHVETMVGQKYHIEKANLALEKDVQLIQIYEWEWNNKKEIIKSKIKTLLGLSQKIMARKTTLRKLWPYERDEFLDQSHIQGKHGSAFAYGLSYEDKLVACMTFGKSRFNKKYDYELIRFSSAMGVNVVGGASKLLAHFRKENKGTIISYADRRWSNGKLYKKLGFTLDGLTEPSFSYYDLKNKRLYNRMTFQKKNLIGTPEYSKSLTEYEIMIKKGFDRIWDAGQYRFVLKN